jgi:phospholipid/cholesterol/gamma-HCH transport system ATP-binding protein
MEAPAVIEVKNLTKAFGKNRVLNDFSLLLHEKENLAVIGKSGSGKSVLIKCIIGLIKPDGGSVNVLGENVLTLSHKAKDLLRARVGFLFQSNALYDSMTVRENLEFPLRRHRQKMEKREVDAMVEEALTNVGLLHTIDMQPSELSGGMKKRVALARTLILKPEIILYDEPTTGLDAITGREISQLMRSLGVKYQTSSIIISHDLSCVEIAADKVAMLIDGKCYALGTLQQLRVSEDPKIRSFFP